MAYTPQDSPIKVSKSLEEKISAASSSSEIQELLKEAAVDQNLAHREWDSTIVTPNEPSATPEKITKVIKFNGVSHTLVADDERSLLAQENAIYRAAMEPASTAPQPKEQPRNQHGQFQAAPKKLDDFEQVELELRWKRGEISSEMYLTESGALDRALAASGIDPKVLKAVVEENQGAQLEKSWAQATEEFLHSAAGADWPGAENMNIAGRLITEKGLVDSPSAETLAAIWDEMKRRGLAVENPEITARKQQTELETKIAQAGDPYELGTLLRSSGSSLFGR